MEEDPISDKLCAAYRAVLVEQINGIKKAIYASALSITTVIVIAQYILNYLV